jgi:hypothetical protein
MAHHGFPRGIALGLRLDYDFLPMTSTILLPCDGCGQLATPEHLAKRLQRLEWTTRYRPVHIGTLFLGAISPAADREFLYAEGGTFAGEASRILEAAGLSPSGSAPQSVLAEFQRAGFLLTHVLECPLTAEPSDTGAIPRALAQQFPLLAARIRRSLRPKRVVPISEALAFVEEQLTSTALGCAVIVDGERGFALDGDRPAAVVARLRDLVQRLGTSAS